MRSHGAFGPGEQRRRPYDWRAAGVDPASFRFGATDRSDVTDGVRKALNPACDAAAPAAPAFVPKAVEDHKLVSADVLGQSRKLGAGDRGLPEDFTFGRPSLPKVRGQECAAPQRELRLLDGVQRTRSCQQVTNVPYLGSEGGTRRCRCRRELWRSQVRRARRCTRCRFACGTWRQGMRSARCITPSGCTGVGVV